MTIMADKDNNMQIIDSGRPSILDFGSPDKGLLIPPMVWCELSDFAPGTVCLCLASGDYDKEGYLGSLEELKAALL